MAAALLAFAPVTTVQAQDQLPVIKAKSKQVSIQDGQNFMKDTWSISPEIKLDTYYVSLPRKGSTVTFITDVESISFKTEFGKTYDFIIMLDGKECRQRISAAYRGVLTPKQSIPMAAGEPDIIPFTMRGSRIYFEGEVNGNKGMSIQFDLGAGGLCVNIDSVAKTGVKFDGQTTLINTSGTNVELTSSKNTIVIGNLKWENALLIQTRNMRSHEDVLVGNTLFGKKVVEIDYDRKVLIVRDQLDAQPEGYTRHEIILEQHSPKIKATVTVAGKPITDWFSFDTGRDATMVIRDRFTRTHDLWDKYKTLPSTFPIDGGKKRVVLDEVAFGGLSFKDVVTNAEDPSINTGNRGSLLGNELLNHFNVILDNPNGLIYLKPNAMPNKTYSTLPRAGER